MPRQKGLFSFSGNFEAQIAEPLDARLKVKSIKALCDIETWTANDGGLYVYKGMVVAVTDDPDEKNNGLYYLINVDDIKNINSWRQIFVDIDFATEDFVEKVISILEKELNEKIDLKATKADIPIKLSQLENDSGFISSIGEDYITEQELTDKNYATVKYVDTINKKLEDDFLKNNYIKTKDIVDDVKTFSSSKPLSANQGAILNNKKVDKEDGKGLSSNDFTNEEKEKLSHIEISTDGRVLIDNIEVEYAVLTSASGNKFKLTVSDDGSLITQKL